MPGKAEILRVVVFLAALTALLAVGRSPDPDRRAAREVTELYEETLAGRRSFIFRGLGYETLHQAQMDAREQAVKNESSLWELLAGADEVEELAAFLAIPPARPYWTYLIDPQAGAAWHDDPGLSGAIGLMKLVGKVQETRHPQLLEQGDSLLDATRSLLRYGSLSENAFARSLLTRLRGLGLAVDRELRWCLSNRQFLNWCLEQRRQMREAPPMVDDFLAELRAQQDCIDCMLAVMADYRDRPVQGDRPFLQYFPCREVMLNSLLQAMENDSCLTRCENCSPSRPEQ